MRGLVLVIAVFCLGMSAARADDTWRIVKDHWSEADEQGFGKFVAAIGESDCSSTESCLRDPSNPYRATDRHFMDIDVDCGKWAYLLRAYYAWKNGLPFSYIDKVSGRGRDLRFTLDGNRLDSRHDIIDHGHGINGPAALRQMITNVFTGTFRTDPSANRALISDFYSPALKPESIRPGTLIYDVNGHVVVVYKVDKSGRAYYMDAHPDFVVTRSVYGAQFGQSPLKLGGGLKNWRPFQVVGAHKDKNGYYIGGHMAYAHNDQIPDYSLIQYTGTEPNPAKDVTKAKFVYDGAELGFYEFARVAISGGKMDYNPIYEIKAMMKSLCDDFEDRARYIDLDISDGIAKRPHPSRLPDNIYGSDDEVWESYASPSRDARIKTEMVQFYNDMSAMIYLWSKRDDRIVYDGHDLQGDLRDAYKKSSKACTITYLNSAKRPVPMTLDDMVRRVFAMSFDPYHCIELRWGASGAERNSCPDSKRKLEWYDAEQRFRNEPGRNDNVRMAFDLDDLRNHAKGSGIDEPPRVDILALINDMPERVALTSMTPVGQ